MQMGTQCLNKINRLYIIPVRANSKRLLNKNIRFFRGKPLLVWSIEQALESGKFSCVAVSSDSEDYLHLAKQAGATHLINRPATLSTDTASTIDVLLHAVKNCETTFKQKFRSVCLLQVTSPLRNVQDIVGALELFESGLFDSVISVFRSKADPYSTLVESGEIEGTYKLCKEPENPIERQQYAPSVFQMNGAVYIWDTLILKQHKKAICENTGVYEMPLMRSVDIDYEDDWKYAEWAAELLLH